MKLTAQDNIIVLGDMGLCWRKDKTDFNFNTRLWETFGYKCNLYWLPGNHENYDIIENCLPEENNMLKCSKHIHMLKTGEIYEFENKKILTIGGADSVDKAFRTKHLNWWEQEQITEEDIAAVLVYRDISLDYILSHAAPAAIVDKYKFILCQLQLDENALDRTSENRLEEIKNQMNFKKWRFWSLSYRC